MKPIPEIPRMFPIGLDLRDRTCLVVGAGSVAAQKIESLLAFGARTRVVAPEADEIVQEWARECLLQWEEKPFEPSDLDGAYVVYGATNRPEVNRAVSAAARERGLLVNVVDVPELCTFYSMAIADFGSVVISIATSGKSPGMAKWLRQRIEETFGPYLGKFADLLYDFRDDVKARYASFDDRRKVWERILDSPALELLQRGDIEAARDVIRSCL